MAGLAEELERLRREGLFRDPDGEAAGGGLDVSSNDYLGYARVSVSRETISAAAECIGAGASRLIFGTHPAHRELEAALAKWVGLPSSLLFTSGFAANVGLIAAIAGPPDLVVSDALNHASIVDGCRLSRAKICLVPHLNCNAIEAALAAAPNARRRWVVTETYFSMDGNSPDLPHLAALCERHDAGLILDEAHALGVLGPAGAGLARQAGVVPAALVGTLGKALGSAGAFIAGAPELRAWLWNRARSFVFSTATSPLLARLTLANVRRAQANEIGRQHLHSLAAQLRRRLLDARLTLPPENHGPIVPVIVSAPDAAVRVARQLADRGYCARAIRPPTVPPASARIRLTVNTTLTRDDVDGLAAATVAACAIAT